MPGYVAQYEGRLVNCIYYYTRTAYTQGSDAEKEPLRTAILRLPDIATVAGSYLLEKRNVTDTAFQPPVRCDIRWALRTPGDDRYFRIPDMLLTVPGSMPDGTEVLRSYVDYEPRDGGILERMCRTQIGDDVRAISQPLPWPVDDEREWKSPLPSIVASNGFGTRHLNRVFASGECALVVKNGERILAHAMNHPTDIAFCEVYFDEHRRITRLDVVNRLPYPEAEIRKYYSGDLFDLKLTISSIRFAEYSEINGVIFPRVVEEYRYHGINSEDVDLKRGEVSEVEARVRAYLAHGTPVVSLARRAEFDLTTLRVNEPLRKEDFVLALPSGTIGETQTGSQYLIGAPGEDMAELVKKAEARGITADFMAGLPALVPRLRLQSMHIPDGCPMLMIKYSNPKPLGEMVNPSPAPKVVESMTNWTAVVSLSSAVAGASALAAVLMLKWRRNRRGDPVMRKVLRLILAVVCAGVGSLSASAEENPRLAELRALLMNAPTLDSFRGAYTLEKRDATGTRAFLARHECRLRGADSWLRIEDLGDPSMLTLTFAHVNGLYAIREQGSCSMIAELDIGFSQIPWGAYLSSRELLGEIHGQSLSEVLIKGKDTLFVHDGHTVLSHRYQEDQERCIDIHLDDKGVIIKIEQCMRPPFSDEEVRTQWAGDLFDVRSLKTTVELRNHQLIGGVMLATVATKTWWGADKSKDIDYHAMAKVGSMSYLEACVADYTSNVRIPTAVQTLELDMSTVEVNADVSDLDLSLLLPAGAHIKDRQTGREYMVASAFPEWRGAITHFFASRGGARSLNERFGIHLAANTAFVSAEPLAGWIKPTLIAGFATSLGSLSFLDFLRKRRDKRKNR